MIIIILDTLIAKKKQQECEQILQKKKHLSEILKNEPRLTKLGDYIASKNNVVASDFIKRTYPSEKKNDISFESTTACSF